MTLQEQINEDLKQAMRDKAQVKLSTLRMLKAGLTNLEKEKKKPLEEADVIAAIRRDLKKLHETIAALSGAQMPDRIDMAMKEIAVLEAYLPAQMDAAQLEVVVKATIEEHGFSSKKDMGQCIRIVKEKVGATADGKAISDLVKQLLP